MDERELKDYWHGVLRALQPTIKRAEFLTWFGNTNAQSCEGGQLILAVPTMFYQSWINTKYLPLITAEAKKENIIAAADRPGGMCPVAASGMAARL